MNEFRKLLESLEKVNEAPRMFLEPGSTYYAVMLDGKYVYYNSQAENSLGSSDIPRKNGMFPSPDAARSLLPKAMKTLEKRLTGSTGTDWKHGDIHGYTDKNAVNAAKQELRKLKKLQNKVDIIEISVKKV